MKSEIIEQNERHFQSIAKNLNGSFDFQLSPSTPFNKISKQVVSIRFETNYGTLYYLATTADPVQRVISGMFAPINNHSSLAFSIQEKDFFDSILIPFKKHVFHSGYHEIQKKFLIRANNADQMRKFLRQHESRQELLKHVNMAMGFFLMPDPNLLYPKYNRDQSDILGYRVYDWIHEEKEIKALKDSMEVILKNTRETGLI